MEGTDKENQDDVLVAVVFRSRALFPDRIQIQQRKKSRVVITWSVTCLCLLIYRK